MKKIFFVLFSIVVACKFGDNTSPQAIEKTNLYPVVPVKVWQDCYKNKADARKGLKVFFIGDDKKEFVREVGVFNCRGSHRIFVIYKEKNTWEEIILPSDLQGCFVNTIEINNNGFMVTFLGIKDFIYFYSYLTRKWIMTVNKKQINPRPQRVSFKRSSFAKIFLFSSLLFVFN